MLNKLFESLDKSIFDKVLIESLEAEFLTAVNEATEAKILIMGTELKDKLITENEVSLVKEKERLITESEEKVEAKISELSEKLNDYLDIVTDEFLIENAEKIEQIENSEKSKTMVEGLNSILICAGIKMETINEAKDALDPENKLEIQVELNNKLVEENLELKNLNSTFLKMGVINENKEGLSIVEADRFERLCELVEFTGDTLFSEKIELLKESVKGYKIDEKLVDEKLVDGKEKMKPISESIKGKVPYKFEHLM